jgi:hypothetical protein
MQEWITLVVDKSKHIFNLIYVNFVHCIRELFPDSMCLKLTALINDNGRWFNTMYKHVHNTCSSIYKTLGASLMQNKISWIHYFTNNIVSVNTLSRVPNVRLIHYLLFRMLLNSADVVMNNMYSLTTMTYDSVRHCFNSNRYRYGKNIL